MSKALTWRSGFPPWCGDTMWEDRTGDKIESNWTLDASVDFVVVVDEGGRQGSMLHQSIMERKSGGEARPKIEIVRVSSIERSNFRPLDGVQLRATYSHVRVGTYCPEPETTSGATAENKPPIEQTRRFKKLVHFRSIALSREYLSFSR